MLTLLSRLSLVLAKISRCRNDCTLVKSRRVASRERKKLWTETRRFCGEVTHAAQSDTGVAENTGLVQTSQYSDDAERNSMSPFFRQQHHPPCDSVLLCQIPQISSEETLTIIDAPSPTPTPRFCQLCSFWYLWYGGIML